MSRHAKAHHGHHNAKAHHGHGHHKQQGEFCCDCRRVQGVAAADLGTLSQKLELTTFTPENITSILQLGEAAQVRDGALRLTECLQWQHGAAWIVAKKLVADGFDIDFDFRLDPQEANTPADGFAFVVQDSKDGLRAVGEYGEGIGYQGIERCLAIEFDTFHNPELDTEVQDGGCHVSIQSCGVEPCSASHKFSLAMSTDIGNIADAQPHNAHIKYNGQTTLLTLELDNRPLLQCNVDLTPFAPTAYLGWTASTGTHMETHDILRFKYAWHGAPSECECSCHGAACQWCECALSPVERIDHFQICPKRQIPCRHCGEKFLWSALPAHESACLQPCHMCGKHYRRAELDTHYPMCPERPLACRFCGTKVPASRLVEHERACPIPCTLCGLHVNSSEMDNHRPVCPCRPLPCQHCKMPFKAKDLPTHEPRCPVPCPLCTQPIPFEDLQGHKDHVCPDRKLPCKTCKKMVKARDLLAHETRCPIPCPLCEAMINADELENHMPVCPDRLVSCRYCNKQVKAKRINAHEARCPIPCPSCNEGIPSEQLEEHIPVCPARPADCQFCGQTFKHFEIEEHEANCATECPRCHDIYRKRDIAEHLQVCGMAACPLCNEEMAEDLLDEHQKICPGRTQQCMYCLVLFPVADHANHQDTCPHQPVVCHGCGVSYPRYQLTTHQAKCGRIVVHPVVVVPPAPKHVRVVPVRMFPWGGPLVPRRVLEDDAAVVGRNPNGTLALRPRTGHEFFANHPLLRMLPGPGQGIQVDLAGPMVRQAVLSILRAQMPSPLRDLPLHNALDTSKVYVGSPIVVNAKHPVRPGGVISLRDGAVVPVSSAAAQPFVQGFIVRKEAGLPVTHRSTIVNPVTSSAIVTKGSLGGYSVASSYGNVVNPGGVVTTELRSSYRRPANVYYVGAGQTQFVNPATASFVQQMSHRSRGAWMQQYGDTTVTSTTYV